jgi:hypothetical protein
MTETQRTVLSRRSRKGDTRGAQREVCDVESAVSSFGISGFGFVSCFDIRISNLDLAREKRSGFFALWARDFFPRPIHPTP